MTEEQDLGFLQHLEELRIHLIRAIAALVLGFIIAYVFHRQLLTILVRPVMSGLRDHGIYALQTISVTEGIMTYIKAAMVAGLALSMPLILREIWLFIAPGLYPRERKVVMPALFVVFLFFLAGMLFSYFFFVPFVVDFLAGMTPNQALLVPRLSDVLSLSLLFYIVFGVIFEVPLIMFILSFLGLFNAHQYLRFSKYFVVAAFIIGALFSPPDPLSQVLLAVPLCALYGLGILASLAVGRSTQAAGALRILGAMALLLILLTGVGYYVSKSAKTQWIVTPGPMMAERTCVKYMDSRVIGGGRNVETRITGPDGKNNDSTGWLKRFRPSVPAGIWCKGVGGRSTVLKAESSGAGFLVTLQGAKEIRERIKRLLPCHDWPVSEGQGAPDVLRVWLPAPGFRRFMNQALDYLKGTL